MENNQEFEVMHRQVNTFLTGNEIAKILKISRSHAYLLMQSGALPTVHIGRSRRVRSKDLETYIEKNLFSIEQE